MKLWKLTTSLIFFAILSGCSPGNNTMPTNPTAVISDETPLPTKVIEATKTTIPKNNPRAIGLPLAMIQLGETVAIGESDFTLSFDEIITDSRCPEDATCIWAGQVKVILSLWQDETLVQSLILTGGELLDEDRNQVTVDFLQITLTDVLPHPALEDKTQQTPEVVLQIKVIE